MLSEKTTVYTSVYPAVEIRGKVAGAKVDAQKITTLAIWDVNPLLLLPVSLEVRLAPDGMLGHY